MRKFFIAIFIIGFILALGTTGTDEIEAHSNEQILTSNQFATCMTTSLILVLAGSIGFTITSNRQNREEKYRGIYKEKVQHPKTIGNTYYARTNGAFVQSDDRKSLHHRSAG